MMTNSGWFVSQMATCYFQGVLSVLQFYNHLISIKYGLHFSNQVKIKMLFNKELIYLKNIYIKRHFRSKCGRNLIHKCMPHNLMVTMVMLLCCYCKCLSEQSLLSHIRKFFKGALLGLRQFLMTESSLKMKKNAFYFTSKALFVLEMFKCLSGLFGHKEKTIRLERYS